MASDKNSENKDLNRNNVDDRDDLRNNDEESSDVTLKDISGRSKKMAGGQNATWVAIVGGEQSLDKLVGLAEAEYKLDKFLAMEKVASMLKSWKLVRTQEESGIGGLKSFGPLKDGSFRDSRKGSSIPLGSPSQELQHFYLAERGFEPGDISLDERISLAVHGGSRNVRDPVQTAQVSLNNSSASEESAEGVNDGYPVLLDSNDEDNVMEMSSYPYSLEVNESSEDNENSRQRKSKIKEISKMSDGEMLTRELLTKELRNNNVIGLDKWDPLMSVLSTDVRKQMIKEIDDQEDVIPLPGILAPPLKTKGQVVQSRDTMLYRVMNDVESVVRGTTQSIALTLDGKGEEAVKKSAKMVLLGSHVLSRLNDERLKIHYPKELALNILKPVTEPIIRKEHRKRFKDLAQEVKDTNLVVRSFFRQGGRTTKEKQGRSWTYKRYQRKSRFFPQSHQYQQNQSFQSFRSRPSKFKNYHPQQKNTNTSQNVQIK
jgi:hypothetical protein